MTEPRLLQNFSGGRATGIGLEQKPVTLAMARRYFVRKMHNWSAYFARSEHWAA